MNKGFVLVIGVLLIYLATTGKLERIWWAITSSDQSPQQPGAQQ